MTINLEHIKNPTPAQLDSFAAIHASCFDKRWSAADIANLLTISGTILIAVEGAFGIVRAIAGEAEILTLAVLPEKRGQGAGSAMLRMMRDVAKPLAETIFLEVRASNAAAIALYEKAGFSLIARRKNYYPKADGGAEDAIVMRCEM